MPSNTYSYIAREGWPALLFAGVLLVIVQLFGFHLLASSLLVVLILLLVFLHRDPWQTIPSRPLAIVSPVHGRVESISDSRDPFLDRPVKCIRLRMTPLDIFSLRSPVEGKVMDQWTRRLTTAGDKGRCYAYWIQTDEGDHVVTSVRLSWPHWRYRFYMQSGERLGQGQRCGFLYFGSVVDVLLPPNVKLEVEEGEKIRSGSSALAVLVHEQPASAYDGPNKDTQATG